MATQVKPMASKIGHLGYAMWQSNIGHLSYAMWHLNIGH